MRALLPALLVLSAACALAQAIPDRPSPPFLNVPKTAHWRTEAKEKTTGNPEADRVISTETWLRGPDFKQVTTYASGRTETRLTINGFGIYSDSKEKLGILSYHASLAAEADPETLFATGLSNPIAMLNWVSEKTFVRLDKFKGTPAYVYERQIPVRGQDAPASPVPPVQRWTVYIDPVTKLPLACAFDDRVYEFANLETNIAIAADVFAIPENVRGAWESQAREQAHQDKLRAINSRHR